MTNTKEKMVYYKKCKKNKLDYFSVNILGYINQSKSRKEEIVNEYLGARDGVQKQNSLQ